MRVRALCPASRLVVGSFSGRNVSHELEGRDAGRTSASCVKGKEEEKNGALIFPTTSFNGGEATTNGMERRATSRVGASHSCLSSIHNSNPSSFSPAPFLQRMTQLINTICKSPAPFSQKKRRLEGVVRSMEQTPTSWLSSPRERGSVDARAYGSFLFALTAATPYLGNSHAGATSPLHCGQDDEAAWMDGSSVFSVNFSDMLAVAVGLANTGKLSHTETLSLLNTVVKLKISGKNSEMLCKLVSAPDFIRRSTTEELCDILRLVSLSVKQFKYQPGPLHTLFSRLCSTPALSERQVLHVLSSLVRLRSPYTLDVARMTSRRGVLHTQTYTARDAVYALACLAFLPNIDEQYASGVLRRVVALSPTLTPRAVGDMSKLLGLLTASRRNNAVWRSCEKEVRRAVLALAERSSNLLGQFTVRDAKYLLRCLQQHDVKHTVVFANLVPFTVQ